MRDPDSGLEALAARWAAEYEARTGHAVHYVRDGGYTFLYDIEGGRPVGAYGHSGQARAPRDATRQRGAPAVRDGDEKGHAIAHRMGGGLDLNLFSQSRRLNHSREWTAIERSSAANPGTPVAIRMHYDDASDRPSTIEYAHVHPERGPIIAEFDNRTGTLVRERRCAPLGERRPPDGEERAGQHRAGRGSAPRGRSEGRS
jgi:DNA/RNA non-specific endonuclease